MNNENPFHPAYIRQELSIKSHLFHIFFGSLFVMIRIPLICIIFCWLVFYHYLIQPMLLFSAAKRIVTLFVNLFSYRTMLFIMGFYKIHTDIKFFGKNQIGNPPPMKSDKVLLTSYFYLACNILPLIIISVSPIFTKSFYRVQSNEKEKNQLLLSPLTFLQSWKLAFSLNYQIPIEGNDMELAGIKHKKLSMMKIIQDSFQEWQGPLLLFFEGASTNQSCILTPQEQMLEDALQIKLKYCRVPVCYILKYPNSNYYSPINTITNPILHLILMLTNWKNELNVSICQMNTNSAQNDLQEQLQQIYLERGFRMDCRNWVDYQQTLQQYDMDQIQKAKLL